MSGYGCVAVGVDFVACRVGEVRPDTGDVQEALETRETQPGFTDSA
jgi:hypothetical protein